MKTTRSNFSRKAITFGVVIFVCIALVATGFAAWMISSGATVEEPGTVDVVTVSNADIQFLLDNLNQETGKLIVDDIVFAPQEGDNSGYIRHTNMQNVDTKENRTENLSFAFSGEVSNGDKVGTLTLAIKVPDSVINAAGFYKDGDNWKYDAESAYITLPSYALDSNGSPLPTLKKVEGEEHKYTADTVNTTKAVELTVTGDGSTAIGDDTFKYWRDSSSNKYKISGKVSFGWGQVFGFGNPGRTLDSIDTTAYENKTYKSYEVAVEDPHEAELLIRLVTFVNAGAKINNSIPANSIKLSTLESLSGIEGKTKAEKVANLNKILKEAESTVTNPTYTIVLTAQPK